MHRPLYKLICLTDSIGNRAFDQTFSMETVHWYFCVCCNDDTVCLCDFLFCQYVLCSAGSPRLYLYKASCLFRCFFDSFRSHIRVCNTSRT